MGELMANMSSSLITLYPVRSKMSLMSPRSSSSSSSSTFYRNLWRLTERNKKRKNESLTSSHSNSDEGVTDYSNASLRQQSQQRSTQTASEAYNALRPKGNVVHRGMDRIRRSFRESFRRRMSRQNLPGGTQSGRQSPNAPGNSSSSGKAESWQPDEAAVRNGTCSFNVKYLGGIEVFESRGMQICEGALKLLRGQRRRPIKAILYVSGDGLRVVDQESSRGLIVDQTIEKVSFCAPDRNHDKGFAYICRDGTSRRWMCHGFQATKESGERLSHAVGCAFAICLERKKKRDAEAAAAIQVAAGLPPVGCEKPNTAGFTLNGITQQTTSHQMSSFERNTGQGSFRRLSITERLRDPQTAIVQQPPPAMASASSDLHITSKPRPIGNPLLFERQGSLRAPAPSLNSTAAFRRQFSLRSYSDSPVKRQQQMSSAAALGKNEPIFEDEEDKNWPSDGGALNEGSTFENAPYDPTKYNGLRQSLSYTAVPSTNTVDFSGIRSYSTLNSPLQVQTNCLSNASAPQSWLSSPISTCPSAGKSKADEWLEQTLRSSLSLNSPYRNVTDHDKMTYTIGEVGPPPGHPPPPLPSSSAYSGATVQNTGSQAAVTRFSSDFSHYELPSINENFTTLNENATVPTTSTESEIDIFGQPIFSPLSPNSQTVQGRGQMMNGSTSRARGATEKPEESDPFDVRWSELALNAAATYHPSPVRSTNPFYTESSAVKI